MVSPHIPVLFNEVVDAFSGINGLFLDCTLGYAGHSKGIISNNLNLRLIACDRDIEAIKFSSEYLKEFSNRVKIIKSPFSMIFDALSSSEVSQLRGILADIGVSSLQIDQNERGFGLNSDVLDMRMDSSLKLSAYDIVADYSKAELERIFYEYAQLPNAAKIASKIVAQRMKKPIQSAKELSSLFGNEKLKGRSVSIATLVFQALRIEVNGELFELKKLLSDIENRARASEIRDCLVAIISFHSLEDKIVKDTFKSWANECICPSHFIKCECGKNHSLGKILTKKPITASIEELAKNSRSSSAKLRLFKIRESNE